MSFHAQLNLTATVERATESTGATGEVTLGWSQTATGVACTIQRRGLRLEQRVPGLRRETTHVAWFPTGTDLRPTAQAGIGDRVLIGGARYAVLQVDNPAAKDRLLRAELRLEV